MYGEQQDDSNFALDPQVLLALAGGAVAGGIGKKYATRELGKGFQHARDVAVAGAEKALSSKEEALKVLQKQLSLIKSDPNATLRKAWAEKGSPIPIRADSVNTAAHSGAPDNLSIIPDSFSSGFKAKYDALPGEIQAARKQVDATRLNSASAIEQAEEALKAKEYWKDEMGLAVGGVPAAMLGYGIGSGVMRKKDDPNDPYRNPLQ